MGKWTTKTIIDPFFQKAKSLKYVSRAAFKLIEIQKKHKLISKGSSVLDLGCAPGAWLQVSCQELGPRSRGGVVLGIDLQDVVLPEAYIDDRVVALKADARDLNMEELLSYAPKGFDVVLSDMLHFTTGSAELDVARSLELTETALRLSIGDSSGEMSSVLKGVLKEKGHLVMKMYEGAGTNAFVQETKRHFQNIARMRPDATRKASREFYLICKERKFQP